MNSNPLRFRDGIYEQLPLFLQDVCQPFRNDSQERDLILLSSLTVLSGCFPTVKGNYDRFEVNANLYSIIIAPPASKKSLAQFAVQLASKVDKDRKLIGAKFEGEEEQKAPKKVGLFLPANASATFLLKRMKLSDLGFVLFDTEADTLGTVLKQEWGSAVSEMLRKSFHHEKLSMGRVQEDLYVEIDSPKLSLLLTGTPDQLRGVVKSFEDGLLSRCLIYSFRPELKWNDVTPKKGEQSLHERFAPFAVTFHRIYKIFIDREYTFEMKPDAWKYFDEHFRAMFALRMNDTGESAAPIIKRAGLIAYRITMVLTLLRNYMGTKESVVYADIRDVETAFHIANVCSLMAINLQKESVETRVQYSKMEMFFEALPKGEFSRAQALEVGKQFTTGDRTIDGWLNKALEVGVLDALKPGTYKK